MGFSHPASSTFNSALSQLDPEETDIVNSSAEFVPPWNFGFGCEYYYEELESEWERTSASSMGAPGGVVKGGTGSGSGSVSVTTSPVGARIDKSVLDLNKGSTLESSKVEEGLTGEGTVWDNMSLRMLMAQGTE